MARPRKSPKTEAQKQRRDKFVELAVDEAKKQACLNKLLSKKSLKAVEKIKTAQQEGKIAKKRWLKIAHDTIREGGLSFETSWRKDLSLKAKDKKKMKEMITNTPICVEAEETKITKPTKGYSKEQLKKRQKYELLKQETLARREKVRELKKKCTFTVYLPKFPRPVSMKDDGFKEVMKTLSEAKMVTITRSLRVKCESGEAATALKNELLDLPEPKRFSILPQFKQATTQEKTQTKAATSTDKQKVKKKKNGQKIGEIQAMEVKDTLLKSVYLYNLQGIKKEYVEYVFPEASKVYTYLFRSKEHQAIRVTRVTFPEESQAEEAAARESVVLNNKKIPITRMTEDDVDELKVKSGLLAIEAGIFLSKEKEEPNKFKKRWSKEMKKTALAIRDPEKDAKKKLALEQRHKVLISGKAGSVKNEQEVVTLEKKPLGVKKYRYKKPVIQEFLLPKNALGERVVKVSKQEANAIMTNFLKKQKIAKKPVLQKKKLPVMGKK